MRIYPTGKPDFDFRIVLGVILDAEGGVVNDSPLPPGYTLTVSSDNPPCFEVAQDEEDPKLVHAHVGEPEANGDPSRANVRADLTDPTGKLIAFISEHVAVMDEPPLVVTPMALSLPA